MSFYNGKMTAKKSPRPLMSATEIRRSFIEYFVSRQHKEVASASLVPAGDPTLLFTNSGMMPFKDALLGTETRSYKRAVTAQRCVRAGGKHNDLGNVGYTARHHTFFEMLGNFSFGDYFKKEAIGFAWELITDGFGLPPDRLWITVHLSDDEARRIWHKDIGIAQERIVSKDEDNFWQMGDTGPCGPCAEIFYDHGTQVAGGPPGSPTEDEGERFIEIWNLVFMQFERAANGTLTPLPSPAVDTGMGLERMAAVLQGVHNNYETDLFKGIIEQTRQLCGEQAEPSSLRIIADHIRSSSFLLADGVIPSNEGRGYVLRRIIRRALRHGNKLGIASPFFHRLVAPLAAEMGDAYPVIRKRQANIESLLKKEEERFSHTLAQGLALLNQEMAAATGRQLDGELVFKLYDTYGFPADLSADIAAEKGLKVAWDGFTASMEEQRKRSRAYSMFQHQKYSLPQTLAATQFVGYAQNSRQARLSGLLDANGKLCQELRQGEEGIAVLDKTPFYAESGGQVGDKGQLIGAAALFKISDTQKQGNLFLHFGKVEEGILSSGSSVQAQIDAHRRQEIRRHHTAIHLLHAAVHRVLGRGAQQRGSRVAENSIRLDFAHSQAMTQEEQEEVEDWVNEQIRRTQEVKVSHSSLADAKAAGAMALFGEKYAERVRVVSIGEISMELCGGTHALNCGELGSFMLLNESSIAAGVRRIEAITSEAAQQVHRRQHRTLKGISGLLQTKDTEQLVGKIDQLNRKAQELDKELAQLHTARQLNQLDERLKGVREVNGTQLLLLPLENLSKAALNELADRCRIRVKSGLVVLANKQGTKMSLLISSSPDIAAHYPADDLVKHLAAQLQGSGGGNAERAKGGSNKELSAAQLNSILDSVADWMENRRP